MVLSAIDYTIIIGCLLLFLGIGIYYNKGNKDYQSFILGGKNNTWFLAGISMVATTFAADTPLAVTELVAKNGISGNWLWWNMLTGGMLTTVIFARLWYRSGVKTELEFLSLRYAGKAALNLRRFKAVYLGLIMNVIVMAWVNKAMYDILYYIFDLSASQAYLSLFGLIILAILYTSIGGLKGVMVTDMIQFFIAMLGAIVLAYFVLDADRVGGIVGLKEQLPEAYLDFFPSQDISAQEGGTLSWGLGAFIAFLGMIWWASWYPGAEPGGGGYVVQRMLSTKSEKDSYWAGLFFQIGHYCLRPFPWIIVALGALVLYSPDFNQVPEAQWDYYVQNTQAKEYEDLSTEVKLTFSKADFEQLGGKIDLKELKAINPDYAWDEEALKVMQFDENPRSGYLQSMMDFLPDGFKGLMLLAFFAAYLSTISTQTNWGVSYLVNDGLGTFDKGRKLNLKLWAQIGVLLLGVLAWYATRFVDDISAIWEFVMSCGAGLGGVLILRWFWMRIHVWSEISAMIAPLVFFSFFKWGLPLFLSTESLAVWNGMVGTHKMDLILTVLGTTLVWVLVTYLVKVDQTAQVQQYRSQVFPSLETQGWSYYKYKLIYWIAMVVFAYAVLFSLGYLIFREWELLLWSGSFVLISMAFIYGLRKKV